LTQQSLFGNPADSDSAKSNPSAPGGVPIAHIDGGARGNPGPAAYGVVVRSADGKTLAELAKYLGIQTNNFAEYSGLIAALEYAKQQKFPALKVISDSELLVKQMNGQYGVKNPGLQKLFTRAKELVGSLDSFSIQHVLRSYNRDADRLVNAILDQEERKQRR
jgi:probable phosphoglycerate mutase